MPNAARIVESLRVLCKSEMHIIDTLRQLFSEHLLPPLSDTAVCCLVACLNHGQLQHRKENIPIMLVCHGHDVAVNLATYVNQSLERQVVHGLNYQDGIGLGALLQQSEDLAQQIDQGNGVLLMVDMPPLTELHEHISRSTGIQCESISGFSLPLLLSVGQRIVSEDVSLEELANDARSMLSGSVSQQKTSIQDRIYNEILSPALTFLNPQKAVDVLSITLTAILQQLHLPQSTEITTKFIIHCSHMLERLILGEALRYDRLKAFVNQNAVLMNELERQMEYPSEVFGVSIPASELAYVAEIFLPYLH
jgi:transcriptional regulatory protein LevR